MKMLEFKYINGVRVFCAKSKEDLIRYALNEKGILIAVNAEKIYHASDGDFKLLINQNIGYPDGIGAVWALKKKGFNDAVKIPGVELWLDIIAQNVGSKTFYLIGATSEVLERTIHKLEENYPGIRIVGARDGYIKEDEVEGLVSDIKLHTPDIVFVAMGSPRQEYLMEKLSSSHKALYQGLGGSFDVYSGKVQRAPQWYLDRNLEWL